MVATNTYILYIYTVFILLQTKNKLNQSINQTGEGYRVKIVYVIFICRKVLP